MGVKTQQQQLSAAAIGVFRLLERARLQEVLVAAFFGRRGSDGLRVRLDIDLLFRKKSIEVESGLWPLWLCSRLWR